jgi:hypothetical protein
VRSPGVSRAAGSALQPRDRRPPGHDAEGVEVEELGQPSGEEHAQLGGEVAPPQLALDLGDLGEAGALQLALEPGEQLAEVGPVREARVEPGLDQQVASLGDLVLVDGEAVAVGVGALDLELPGGEHAGPELPPDRLDVVVLQLEGGGDRHGVGDLGALPAAQAARVVAQLLEAGAAAERVGPVERLEEGGLAALVLADQAGHVRLEPNRAGVLDAPELPDHRGLQDHSAPPERDRT